MSDEAPTSKQKQYLIDLGISAIPNDLTRAQASAWIDEVRSYNDTKQRGTIPERKIRTDIYDVPPGGAPKPVAASSPAAPIPVPPGATGFQSAKEASEGKAPPPIAPAPEASAIAVPEQYESEERGPLTPVQVMTKEERESYGLGETDTVVIPGRQDKTQIVPEYGLPAKFLFARLSRNARTGRTDVRVFASIEGLVFRANAFCGGIKKLSFRYVDPKEIPGLAAFIDETKDPQIIARCSVTLGNGTEVEEEGTVRLSEIQLHPSRRDPRRMVARSPVARDYVLELAKKRSLARCLRWGTNFGGTALDELPPDEAGDARVRAGLPESPAGPAASTGTPSRKDGAKKGGKE
jgi:hypothetical protein